MLSFVVPCYNEAENIVPLFDEIKAILHNDFAGVSYEIIFVDDGSKDATWKQIVACKAKDAHVIGLRLQRNYGQSIALDAGFQRASGDVIISLDADLQNDPKDVKKLYTKLIEEDLDIVTGWRKKRKDPLSIRLITKFAKFLRKILINDGVQDSGCTLRVYRSDVIHNLYLRGEMHRYIIAIAKINGYRIGELEVNHRARTAGYSKYNRQKSIRGLVDLMYIWFLGKFQSRPLHLFGLAGVLSVVLGCAFWVITIYQKFFQDLNINRNGYFFLGFFFTVMGVFVFVMGIMLDIMIRTYHNTSRILRYFIREEI